MNFIKEWWLARKRKKELAKAPKNIKQAILELDKHMSAEAKLRFVKEAGDYPGSRFHFGGGMAMRNSWGLWDKDQPLTQWFREYGVWHADDMSASIYKAYWCHLNNVPFNMVKEAIECERYWKEQGIGFDGEELPNYSPTTTRIIKIKK